MAVNEGFSESDARIANAMQILTVGESSPAQYEAIFDTLTRSQEILGSVSDDGLLGLNDETDSYMVEVEAYETKTIEADKEQVRSFVDSLIVARIAGADESVTELLMAMAIDPADWPKVLDNLDQQVIPQLERMARAEELARKRRETRPRIAQPDFSEELVLGVNRQVFGEAVNQVLTVDALLTIATVSKQEKELKPLSSAAEILDQVFFDLPLLDPERALKVYQKGLDSGSPEAPTIALGLDNLIYMEPIASLPIVETAAHYGDDEVRYWTQESIKQALSYAEDQSLPTGTIHRLLDLQEVA